MRPSTRRFSLTPLLCAVGLAAVIGGASACAARATAVAPPPAPVDDASPLIARGCYSCLEQAFARAQAKGLRSVAFEAAALLVFRSKELGLPHDEWLAQARQLGSGPGDALALDIVDAIPIDPLADREASFDFARRTRLRANQAAWRDAVRSADSSPVFRAYLEASIICGGRDAPERDNALAEGPWVDAAVVQYRIGSCASTLGDRLRKVRAADGDLIDADYALARYALEGSSPDPDEALRLLRSAAAAFPRSAAIATLLGQQHQTREEWADALAAFDRAMAASATAVDAALGRVIALSSLARREDAIDAATRLIDGGRWFVGESHYWRAWNELALGRLDAARADADRARSLMANPAVFILSGLVDWRLKRLESAEAELERALSMDFGQCEAAQYLGGVRGERARLPEARAALVQARQCYDLSLTLRREAIIKIRSGPGSEVAKDRGIRQQERAIKEVEAKRIEVESGLRAIDQALERSSEGAKK